MELAFATKPLREICEDEKKAKLKLGTKVAAVLKHRLADLRAADSVDDLPISNLAKRRDDCALELSGAAQLVFCPNHVTAPPHKSGVDWAKVTRIKITKVGISE